MSAPSHPNPPFSAITLRDYFAGQALAGVIGISADHNRIFQVGRHSYRAEEAYAFADALLAERAKSQPEQTSTPDDDGWIEWHGGECPVGDDDLLEVRFRDGSCSSSFTAGGWRWHHEQNYGDIIAYRPVQS